MDLKKIFKIILEYQTILKWPSLDDTTVPNIFMNLDGCAQSRPSLTTGQEAKNKMAPGQANTSNCMVRHITPISTNSDAFLQ